MKKPLVILVAAGTVTGLLLVILGAAPKKGANPAEDPLPVAPSVPVDSFQRGPSSAPPFKGRIPTTSNPLERLDRDSQGKWRIKRGRDGMVTRMTGGSLPLGSRAAVVASAEFLHRYGEGLLGVAQGQLALEDSKQEGVTAQVIYRQLQDGLPVFGSRLNLIFDREGNLVHLVSDLYASPFPSPIPLVGARMAAATVRAALERRLQQDGYELSDDAVTDGELESWGQLGFRMYGPSIALVYRYNFTLSNPGYSDMEAYVDARTGAIVSLRSNAKN